MHFQLIHIYVYNIKQFSLFHYPVHFSLDPGNRNKRKQGYITCIHIN